MKYVFYLRLFKIVSMETFVEITNQIKEATEKRKQLIITAMDGRTQRSIAEKTGIDETKLSKWINGFGDLENSELVILSKILGTSFKG